MRYLWLCLLVLGFMPTHAQSPAESDAPYLYYYSDIVDGFIIERADGTDSRVLGAGLVYPETNSVGGAGWSPSGEWFAFISFDQKTYNAKSIDAVVINVSGEWQITALQDILEVEKMQWIPNQDILLVETITKYDAEKYISTRDYYWIDVTTDTLLNKYSLQFHPDMDPNIYWLNQGEYLFMVFAEPSEGIFDYFYKVFDACGNLFHEEDLPAIFVGLSPQGWLVYADGVRLTFSNLLSKASFSLNLPATKVYFSPDEHYALLSNETTSYLVNLSNSSFQTLPSYKVVDSPRLFHNLPALEGMDRAEVWSPDSQYFIALDKAYNLFLVSSETLVSMPLAIKVHINNDVWQWKKDHQLTFYDTWSSPTLLYLFDPENARFEKFEFSANYSYAYFSDDFTQLAYVWDGAIIENLTTNEVLKLKPRSDATTTAAGGEIIWNSDSKWLITTDDASKAGGGLYMRWVNVANKTGQVNRELTYCAVMNSVCAGWLPERVDTSQLP